LLEVIYSCLSDLSTAKVVDDSIPVQLPLYAKQEAYDYQRATCNVHTNRLAALPELTMIKP